MNGITISAENPKRIAVISYIVNVVWTPKRLIINQKDHMKTTKMAARKPESFSLDSPLMSSIVNISNLSYGHKV